MKKLLNQHIQIQESARNGFIASSDLLRLMGEKFSFERENELIEQMEEVLNSSRSGFAMDLKEIMQGNCSFTYAISVEKLKEMLATFN